MNFAIGNPVDMLGALVDCGFIENYMESTIKINDTESSGENIENSNPAPYIFFTFYIKMLIPIFYFLVVYGLI